MTGAASSPVQGSASAPAGGGAFTRGEGVHSSVDPALAARLARSKAAAAKKAASTAWRGKTGVASTSDRKTDGFSLCGTSATPVAGPAAPVPRARFRGRPASCADVDWSDPKYSYREGDPNHPWVLGAPLNSRMECFQPAQRADREREKAAAAQAAAAAAARVEAGRVAREQLAEAGEVWLRTQDDFPLRSTSLQKEDSDTTFLNASHATASTAATSLTTASVYGSYSFAIGGQAAKAGGAYQERPSLAHVPQLTYTSNEQDGEWRADKMGDKTGKTGFFAMLRRVFSKRAKQGKATEPDARA